MNGLNYVLGGSLVFVLAACSSDATSVSGGEASSGSSSGGAGSEQPLLAYVDSDGKSLNATPGQGVGVFTTYQAGGHWHITWTCDTSVSGAPCTFQLAVSVATGAFSNVLTETSADFLYTTSGSPAFTLDATTTNLADGVTFDTLPGATITVDATVGGQSSGSYLFFVQNGLVNGGFSGTLTDPMMFEPSSP